MKISIITPTYNCQGFIRETIESIHSQTYQNFEHIVVDGQSTDQTVNIVKEFEDISLICEKDNGQSDAINKGLRKATGDILAWQNADDLYERNTFETVVRFFERHPEIDIVYGNYRLIDSKSRWICDVFPIDWSKWKFAHGRFCPLQPTVFWRREVTDKVGELNEQLHYCMDVDFFARVVTKGFTFARIPKILGSFRIHNQSKTQSKSNDRLVAAEYEKVLSEHFNYGWHDSILFNLFQWRAKLGKRIKTGLSNHL